MHLCNFCKQPLEYIFANLGHQPPSNSFLTKDALLLPEVHYPLIVYICKSCWLVQVPETKMARDIFSEKYPYFSSESPSNVAHAKEYVEMIVERFDFNYNARVLEIGSNDGYMLQWFKKHGIKPLGIDPCFSACQIASKNYAIETDNKFWSTKEAKRRKPFDLICGINVLAHQPDINDFVEGLRIALAPDGIITMEFPWLVKTIDGVQFDQIYHEHFSYFSFATICAIFQKHKLEIFDVDELPEHGGSLRIYARHKGNLSLGRDNWVRYDQILLKEKGMNTLNYYSGFQSQINEIKVNLMEFLYDVKYAEGATVVAYGAAAKANTFMNYCGIKPDLIDCIVDRSPHKQGLYCPGSHIPVVAEEDGIMKMKPDYVLITAWNLKAEIMEQLKYIKGWGGKFVIAIPKLEIL